jgi:hypothetical protein
VCVGEASIVNKVVDTLDLRLSRNSGPSSWLLDQVEGWRRARDEWTPGDDPFMVQLGGLGTFRLMGSSRPFEFVLAHPEICDIRIWRPESWDKAISTHTGQLMFNFRSKFLQLVGVHQAREFVHQVVALLIAGPPVYTAQYPRPDFLRVARGDLAVDVAQSQGLRWEDLKHFVCRSLNTDIFTTLTDLSRKQLLERVLGDENTDYPPMDNKGVSIPIPAPGLLELAAVKVLDAYADLVKEELEEMKQQKKWAPKVTRSVMQGRTPQTVYFGRFTSPIFAKVYNKLASLRPQKKLYMLDVWADQGWSGDSHVWRWEWTFTGDFLKSVYIGKDRVDIRELDTFLEYIPSLWFYVTRNWLRQVNEDPQQNHHTERMTTTLYWALIQSAWPSQLGVERDHSRDIRVKDDADKERRINELEAQARGCMVTASALKASRYDEGMIDFEAGYSFDKETGEVSINYSEVAQSDVSSWLTELYDVDVDQRRKQIGADDLSDSALTSLQRAQRMLEGSGS